MKHFFTAAAAALTATTMLVQPAVAKTDALAQRVTKPELRVLFDPHLNIDDLMSKTSAAERAPLTQVADYRKGNRRLKTRKVRRSVAKPRRIKKQMTSVRKRRRNGGPTSEIDVEIAFDFMP